eukprot:CAMPEP_0201721756 /NCGR_PEP_ID=MMETSP0593-20130828/6355_1 /ASSEMBLY_ACC=CAM_ASM_000672 /TAXON_ID=267983 /ORGANISM="Skeletonema japonicum, Strain CCMP2506" /LENGTH=854 /DNA_ID=CAMNT_0048212625 /DNA_START=72 /DNA_END=2637 /DNA_ORIENTATION=+
MDDVEQQRQAPGRRGINRAMQGESVNFSDYLSAQRNFKSQRLLQRRTSVRNLNVPSIIEEEETEEAAYSSPHSSRQLHRLRSAEWNDIFDNLGDIDENGQFHDEHDHLKPFYSPPVQRQRWGEDQVLPHVNWGDLFFDLFYVGMAYNLGVMLKSSMNNEHWLRGIIYFVGVFGSLWTSWEIAMQYESRYMIFDYSHRLFEVIRFLFISTAILHITPIEFMSDTSSAECLTVTVSIFMESIMHLILSCELYYKAKGDRESIKNHTIDNVYMRLLPMSVVYLAAAIIAIVLFVQSKTNSDSKYYGRLLASTEYYGSSAATPIWKLSDLPFTLLAGYYLLSLVTTALARLQQYKTMDIRKRFVPSNIDFEIHRYGEWILLMIGEGVLSLLIVATTESSDYYIITTIGVLTMIFIQILTFESAPSHSEGHALWRSYLSGMSFSMLNQLLSMSLIIMGLSYKVFLLNVLKEDEDSAYDGKTRALAPSSDINNSVAAAFYAGSLFVVLVSLELTTLTHTGLKETFNNMCRRDGGSTRLYWPVVVMNLLKLGLTLFALTLWVWTADPDVLSICGFTIVLSLTVTRVLNFFFVHQKALIDEAAARVTERFLSAGTTRHDDSDVTPHSKRHNSIDDLTGGINSSFDGIIVADLNGVISTVNETARQLFGYETKEEIIGKNLSILCGGSDGKRHDGYVKAFKKKLLDDPSCVSNNKVLGQQRMLHASRADGTEFPCVIGIKLVSNNKMIAGYIRDMTGVLSTEKKRVSVAMRINEAVDRVCDDHAYDAIIATDRGGKIQKVNAVAVTEFGYESKDELVGMNLSVLMHGVIDHPEFLLDSHGKQRVISITRKDGSEMNCIELPGT